MKSPKKKTATAYSSTGCGRWEEFRERYLKELADINGNLEKLHRCAQSGTVTLVFGARDTERNNAVVLNEYLEEKEPV